jgi:hypothetical protein
MEAPYARVKLSARGNLKRQTRKYNRYLSIWKTLLAELPIPLVKEQNPLLKLDGVNRKGNLHGTVETWEKLRTTVRKVRSFLYFAEDISFTFQ